MLGTDTPPQLHLVAPEREESPNPLHRAPSKPTLRLNGRNDSQDLWRWGLEPFFVKQRNLNHSVRSLAERAGVCTPAQGDGLSPCTGGTGMLGGGSQRHCPELPTASVAITEHRSGTRNGNPDLNLMQNLVQSQETEKSRTSDKLSPHRRSPGTPQPSPRPPASPVPARITLPKPSLAPSASGLPGGHWGIRTLPVLPVTSALLLEVSSIKHKPSFLWMCLVQLYEYLHPHQGEVHGHHCSGVTQDKRQHLGCPFSANFYHVKKAADGIGPAPFMGVRPSIV